MQPLLWTMHGPNLGRAKANHSPLGTPALTYGYLPMPTPPMRLTISGITKDSTGAVLGSCTVSLYRTNSSATSDHDALSDKNDVLMERLTSDAVTGAYSFSAIGLGSQYYVVAYRSGTPDVAGTTVNTLVGT